MTAGPASSYTAFAFNVLIAKLKRTQHLPLAKFSALLPSSVSDNSAKYPLFVTWNIFDKRYGEYILRGCIGTFAAQAALEEELESYALTA